MIDQIFKSKGKVSQGKKKSHTKRKNLMGKEKVSWGKKKSHGERTSLSGKEKVSCRKKLFYNKTRKKLKTIVINKTICAVLIL